MAFSQCSSVTTSTMRPLPDGGKQALTSTVCAYGGINPRVPQGSFAGGLLVCMADGSVHFVNQGVSYESWQAAMSPASDDAPGGDF